MAARVLLDAENGGPIGTPGGPAHEDRSNEPGAGAGPA